MIRSAYDPHLSRYLLTGLSLLQLLAIPQALEQLVYLATLNLHTLTRHSGTSPASHTTAGGAGVSQAASLIIAVVSARRRIMRVEVELAHDTLYIPRVSRMVQEESILLQIAPNDRNVAFRRVDKEL